MADLDGDGILELIGAYNWQDENYIIVLKYYNGVWHVADIIKGKWYNITYFNILPSKIPYYSEMDFTVSLFYN
ncbi:hypothetical protein [uncultured Clostridium sp.]|uniref:hypothetical protein n=1 Tax=uncultured Clostridium sp. TaxID=59620 RepID=UPI0028ED8936|nr:hypothetical protein [uncultured Clostridium sp.]